MHVNKLGLLHEPHYAARQTPVINSLFRIFKVDTPSMDGLNRLLAGGGFPGMGGQGAAPMGDTPQVDNSEIIYISPLSLLKVKTT